MTIVQIPARQRQQYRVHSVTAQRPVAMTVEMLNGLGAADEGVTTTTTVIQEKLDWGLILSIAIPLAIIVPMILSGLSEDK